MCIYVDRVTQPLRGYQFVSVDPQRAHGLQQGGSAATRAPSPAPAQSDPPAIVTEERLENIERRLDTLGQIIDAIRERQVPSQQRNVAAQLTVDEQAETSENDEAPSVMNGYLSNLGGGRVRYVDSTLWAYMCTEAAELDELLSSQSRYHPIPVTPLNSDAGQENAASTQQSRSSRSSTTVTATKRLDTGMLGSHVELAGDIAQHPPANTPAAQVFTKTLAPNTSFLRDLPVKEECDALLDAYINGYHPIVPLIHVAAFRRRYEQFWHQLLLTNKTDAAQFLSFSALLVAVLYGGSVSNPEPWRHQSTAEHLPKRLHKLALKALRLANFPHTPTVDSFTAYLICQATEMREEEPLSCVAFVGLALRVATMLGLHRDLEHFPNIGPIEAEVRRRVWWQLVHIDILVAFASGLPTIIDLNIWDVRTVSELKEEYIGTSAGAEYDLSVRTGDRQPDAADDPEDQSSLSMVSTMGILVAGKLQCSCGCSRKNHASGS